MAPHDASITEIEKEEEEEKNGPLLSRRNSKKDGSKRWSAIMLQWIRIQLSKNGMAATAAVPLPSLLWSWRGLPIKKYVLQHEKDADDCKCKHKQQQKSLPVCHVGSLVVAFGGRRRRQSTAGDAWGKPHLVSDYGQR